jgi:hypothetical protein
MKSKIETNLENKLNYFFFRISMFLHRPDAMQPGKLLPYFGELAASIFRVEVSFILKMDVVGFSETSETEYQTAG